MKRGWACLLAVCLLLGAVPAMALEHDFSGAFTMTYPDNWELDTKAGTEDNTATYQYLGELETPVSWIEIGISDDRAYYEGFSVPLTMNSEYFWYLSSLMGMLEEDDDTAYCEYVQGIKNKDETVIFQIIYVEDGAGGYYYADTMIGGCTLFFYAYSTSTMVQTGARQLAELTQVLESIHFDNALFE